MTIENLQAVLAKIVADGAPPDAQVLLPSGNGHYPAKPIGTVTVSVGYREYPRDDPKTAHFPVGYRFWGTENQPAEAVVYVH